MHFARSLCRQSLLSRSFRFFLVPLDVATSLCRYVAKSLRPYVACLLVFIGVHSPSRLPCVTLSQKHFSTCERGTPKPEYGVHKAVTPAEISVAIRNIPDFPKPGIQFKDITPVLQDARLFAGAIELLTQSHVPGSIDAVVGIDARGFIFASAAAIKLQTGFVPIRKKGKLPFLTHEESYDLEYGSNTVAIHIDAVKPGSKVLLVDDLLATGGTAGAAIALLNKIGAEIVEASFLIELAFLNGRAKLDGVKARSLIQY